MAKIGNFRYQLALDPRLLARVIDEAQGAAEKLKMLSRWAKYANRRLEQIKNAPETVVYKLEDGTLGCFLVDNSIQTPFGPALKPICGNENSRDGLVCTRPRGIGTWHQGKGLCLDCEKKRQSAIYRSGSIYKPRNEVMIQLNRANQMPARLTECLDVAEKMDRKILSDIVPDLKSIYGVIQFVLEGGLHRITPEERESGSWQLEDSDVKLVNTLLKTAIECKKVMFVMEKQSALDPNTVKAFVGQVLSVVYKHVDPSTARKIGGEVLDTVIKPFRNQGHLSGAEEEYHDIGKGMVKAISSYAGVDPSEVQFPIGSDISPEDLQRRADEGLNVLKKHRKDFELSTGNQLEDPALKEQRKKERRAARRRRSL